MKLPHPHLTKQFMAFCVVGVVNTLITITVHNLLVWLGAPAVAAFTGGYAAGMTNGFLMNKFWTFRASSQGRHVQRVAKFVAVNLVAWAAGSGVVKTVVAMGILSPAHSVLAAIPVALAINFTGHKLWTFRAEPVATDRGV
jgi:putative flippase GtrA